MLREVIKETSAHITDAIESMTFDIKMEEIGRTISVGDGVAKVKGLPNVKNEELLDLGKGLHGMAFNLDSESIGVILLGDDDELSAGSEVHRTGRVISIPVGESLLGRMMDPLGNPVDDPERRIETEDLLPIEQEAPDIMARAPVTEPVQTGLKAIDALIPIGRGQRQLILGDRQTGKTAIALDTIINQRGTGIVCVFCSIGQRESSIAGVMNDLQKHGALDYTTVVAAGSESAPGLRFIAPYAATSVAEYFVKKGRDVIIVYDDLTKHARAYREISLLLERPPGREAYPGDIFYIHSRLLERAAHYRDKFGGGSMTAFPIIETQAQNISSYIPTNLISITDGQIYLSPQLYRKGHLPAIDIGKSVSRVGGKAQFPSYREVTGDLRLTYTQFEEVETFSRFGTRLDKSTRETLRRGRRIREVLNQPQFKPLRVCEQIAVLSAVTHGVFDSIDTGDIAYAENVVTEAVTQKLAGLCSKLDNGEKPGKADSKTIIETAKKALRQKLED